MPTNRLTRKQIEALNRVELRKYLEDLTDEDLKWSLEVVSNSTLVAGIECIRSPSVLKRAIDCLKLRNLVIVLETVDYPTLKFALNLAAKGTLEAGLENVQLDSLGRAMNSLNDAQLKLAVTIIDDNTLKDALARVDAPTKKAMDELLVTTWDAWVTVDDCPGNPLEYGSGNSRQAAIDQAIAAINAECRGCNYHDWEITWRNIRGTGTGKKEWERAAKLSEIKGLSIQKPDIKAVPEGEKEPPARK